MSAASSLSLPQIYENLSKKDLSSNGIITPQQYDEFAELWEDSIERRCILLNCDHYSRLPVEKGRVLLPLVDSRAEDDICSDEQAQNRSIALSESIREFLWFIVANFGVLPILEILTPPAAEYKSLLDNLQQDWISIYIANFALVYEEPRSSAGLVDHEAEKIDIDPYALVGWADEPYVATYGLNPPSDPLEFPKDWRAYDYCETKIALQTYSGFAEYHRYHKAELAAGYKRGPSGWILTVVNGLSVSEAVNPIRMLFGEATSGFSRAVFANIASFRPWFLNKKYDPHELSSDASLSDHKAARIRHMTALELCPSEYAITLTHSHAPEGSSRRSQEKFSQSSNRSQIRASGFATCLFSLPSSISEDKLRSELDKAFPDIVSRIWDGIDALKLPVTRELTADAWRQLELEKQELEATARMFKTLKESVTSVNRTLFGLQHHVHRMHSYLLPPDEAIFSAYPLVERYFQRQVDLQLSLGGTLYKRPQAHKWVLTDARAKDWSCEELVALVERALSDFLGGNPANLDSGAHMAPIEVGSSSLGISALLGGKSPVLVRHIRTLLPSGVNSITERGHLLTILESLKNCFIRPLRDEYVDPITRSIIQFFIPTAFPNGYDKPTEWVLDDNVVLPFPVRTLIIFLMGFSEHFRGKVLFRDTTITLGGAYGQVIRSFALVVNTLSKSGRTSLATSIKAAASRELEARRSGITEPVGWSKGDGASPWIGLLYGTHFEHLKLLDLSPSEGESSVQFVWHPLKIVSAGKSAKAKLNIRLSGLDENDNISMLSIGYSYVGD